MGQDFRVQLLSIIRVLEEVEVKGRDNMVRLVGAMNELKRLADECQEKNE